MVAEEVGPSGCEEGGTGTERQETRPWEYNPARRQAAGRDHGVDILHTGGAEEVHSIPCAAVGTSGDRKMTASTVAAASTVAHIHGR
jgi:hypothetical protein